MAAYCAAVSKWIAAELWLAKIEAKSGSGDDPPGGALVLKSGTGGIYQNPYLHVSNAAQEKMAKYGAVLGLDPISRERLKVSAQGGKEKGIPSRDRSKGPPPPKRTEVG